MRNEYDTLGRATVFNTKIDPSIRCTKRGLVWLEALAWHHYLNSTYLHDFSLEFGKDVRSSRFAMLRHRLGGYLHYSYSQRRCEMPSSNFYIYDVGKRGIDALKDAGRWADFIPSSGSFEHRYGTGCVTGSIHLGAKRAGVTYEPGHVQLAKQGTTLRYGPLNLNPDQLFSLTYPNGSWRFFAVEFDRSYLIDNEDGTARPQHKSGDTFAKKIENYTRYIGDGLYKEHLGINTGMVVLFVFTSPGAEAKFHAEIAKQHKKCTYLLTQTVDGFFPLFNPQRPYYDLFDGEWRRHGCDPMLLHSV